MKRNNAIGKYVKPFTELEVKRIKKELTSKPNKRNLCLFIMGINQGIRATDLLNIRIKDVCSLSVGERHSFKEGKTQKINYVYINEATHGAISIYLDSLPSYDDNDYLFKSRTGNKAITLQQFGVIVKEWCQYAKIQNSEDYGTRSLRKTFGRLTFNDSTNANIISLLKMRFNHSSEKVTYRYLDITRADMEKIFTNK